MGTRAGFIGMVATRWKSCAGYCRTPRSTNMVFFRVSCMPSSLVDGILQAEKLSESSKMQYLEKLATLKKIMGKPLEYIVDNPRHVASVLKQRYACPLTQRAFIAAIKAVFNHTEGMKVSKADTYQQLTEYQNDMSQAVHERYMAAEPSDKERQNWVTWNDVMLKERHLAMTEYGSPDHLLLAMYCLIEPMRQDYGSLRILVDREPPTDVKGNFLVIAADGSSGRLVLNTYKTAKSYGTYERTLPIQLLSIIKASLVSTPRAHLFVDESGEPYRKKNSFTKFSNRTLKRLFGKNFTVSLMRHSHISNIDFNASTPGQLIEKSRNMAHSLTMQQLYRRHIDPLPPLTVVKQSPMPAQPTSSGASGVMLGRNGDRYLSLSL